MAKYSFWEGRWHSDYQPWHSPASDHALAKALPSLREQYGIADSAKAFVPLCGNSIAVRMLYEAGFCVSALDFVPEAVLRLIREQFAEIAFAVDSDKEPRRFEAQHLQLDVMDVFDCSTEPRFDLIYDRAALIALPEDERIRYAALLSETMKKGAILFAVAIENCVKDRSCGPPFSMPRSDIPALFPTLELLEQRQVAVIEPAKIHAEVGAAETAEYVSVLRKC